MDDAGIVTVVSVRRPPARPSITVFCFIARQVARSRSHPSTRSRHAIALRRVCSHQQYLARSSRAAEIPWRMRQNCTELSRQARTLPRMVGRPGDSQACPSPSLSTRTLLSWYFMARLLASLLRWYVAPTQKTGTSSSGAMHSGAVIERSNMVDYLAAAQQTCPSRPPCRSLLLACWTRRSPKRYGRNHRSSYMPRRFARRSSCGRTGIYRYQLKRQAHQTSESDAAAVWMSDGRNRSCTRIDSRGSAASERCRLPRLTEFWWSESPRA